MKTLKFIGILILIPILSISCTNEDLINQPASIETNLQTPKNHKKLQKSKTDTSPIVLGYFPSWQENWPAGGKGTKLRDIPEHVTHVFLAFAKPNLTYQKGSYDISGTGIQTPYGGTILKKSVAILKAKGIKVLLSIGGETYWATSAAYNINYQQIKDLIDDIGFEGIDWDFEPNGSFAQIGSPENIQHFIDFFNNSRAIMPQGEYLLTCAPSGAGALGGLNNDDPSSPFAYSKRNTLTGESDTNLYNATTPNNGISLFGFSSTGHMIPVIEAVGDKIDFIAYQGYNVGAPTNRKIMYDSYRHYADQYGFSIVAGTHFPEEPWGPYYTFSYDKVADLSDHIKSSQNPNDGIMIWQLLLKDASSSSYGYLHVASQVLNDVSTSTAIANAENYPLSPYTGDSNGDGNSGETTGCDNAPTWNSNSVYTGGQQAVYNGTLYEAKWWTQNNNPSTSNGTGSPWKIIKNCSDTGDGTETNQAPTAFLTSPSSNSNFNENENITLTANATDTDGTISNVEFYSGNTKLGEDSTSPYELVWQNVSTGSYNLYIKATDNEGSTTTSSSVSINVTSTTSGGGSGNTDCSNASEWKAYPSVYNTGDIVKYQNKLYEAQTGPMWVTPGSGEHWWKTIGTCN